MIWLLDTIATSNAMLANLSNHNFQFCDIWIHHFQKGNLKLSTKCHFVVAIAVVVGVGIFVFVMQTISERYSVYETVVIKTATRTLY